MQVSSELQPNVQYVVKYGGNQGQPDTFYRFTSSTATPTQT